MEADLKKEFDYYLKNQESLVEKYTGKILVIKEQQVIGVYDSEKDAIETTTEKHELGSFLVQKCSPGDLDYTQIFHSRVCLV